MIDNEMKRVFSNDSATFLYPLTYAIRAIVKGRDNNAWGENWNGCFNSMTSYFKPSTHSTTNLYLNGPDLTYGALLLPDINGGNICNTHQSFWKWSCLWKLINIEIKKRCILDIIDNSNYQNYMEVKYVWQHWFCDLICCLSLSSLSSLSLSQNSQ